MSLYTTKQKTILLDFLKIHPDKIFSTSQLVDCLKLEKISSSSVYRNLAELEALGEIRKVNKTGTREAFYKYVNAEECKEQLHLFCLKCEQFIHMNKLKAETLKEEILEDDGFEIDCANTIIYGICKNCKT